VKQEEVESELPDLFTSFLGLGIPELPLADSPNEQDAQSENGDAQDADALSDDTEQLLGSLQLKKEPSPEGGEKQAKRRQQVAAACRRSRAKKKREVEELQGQVVALHKERSENMSVIETLRQQIEEMKTTSTPLKNEEVDRLREENGVSTLSLPCALCLSHLCLFCQELQKRLKSHEQFVEAFKGLADAAPLDNAVVMNKRVCTGVGINGQAGEKKAAAVEQEPVKREDVTNSDHENAPSAGSDEDEGLSKKLKHKPSASPSSSSSPTAKQDAKNAKENKQKLSAKTTDGATSGPESA
jgi:hypothetical protein